MNLSWHSVKIEWGMAYGKINLGRPPPPLSLPPIWAILKIRGVFFWDVFLNTLCLTDISSKSNATSNKHNIWEIVPNEAKTKAGANDTKHNMTNGTKLLDCWPLWARPRRSRLPSGGWQKSLLKAASDMEFVKNFTHPDFQAKSFTPQKCVICDSFFGN